MKHTVCFALAVVLVGSLFAGCRMSKPQETTPTTAVTTPMATTPQPTTTRPTTPAPTSSQSETSNPEHTETMPGAIEDGLDKMIPGDQGRRGKR